VQAVGRPPQRAPDGGPLHYERHRPEQTTLYRLVQQHAASFIAHTEANTGAELPSNIQGRVRRLPRIRHPGPRLPAAALRRVRPRQVAGLQLQAPRVLSLMRCAPDVADRGAPGGSRHPPRAGAAVGAVSADPAARAAGCAARTGHAGRC